MGTLWSLYDPWSVASEGTIVTTVAGHHRSRGVAQEELHSWRILLSGGNRARSDVYRGLQCRWLETATLLDSALRQLAIGLTRRCF